MNFQAISFVILLSGYMAAAQIPSIATAQDVNASNTPTLVQVKRYLLANRQKQFAWSIVHKLTTFATRETSCVGMLKQDRNRIWIPNSTRLTAAGSFAESAASHLLYLLSRRFPGSLVFDETVRAQQVFQASPSGLATSGRVAGEEGLRSQNA